MICYLEPEMVASRQSMRGLYSQPVGIEGGLDGNGQGGTCELKHACGGVLERDKNGQRE